MGFKNSLHQILTRVKSAIYDTRQIVKRIKKEDIKTRTTRAYVPIPPTTEELTEKEKLFARRARESKIKELYNAWQEKAQPILNQILIENPDVLTQLEYRVYSNSPYAGGSGSFYDPRFFGKRARSNDNGTYAIDTITYENDRVKKGEEQYSLEKVAGIIADRVLNEHNLTEYWEHGKKIKRTGRHFLTEKIKSKTGRDLRKEVK